MTTGAELAANNMLQRVDPAEYLSAEEIEVGLAAGRLMSMEQAADFALKHPGEADPAG